MDKKTKDYDFDNTSLLAILGAYLVILKDVKKEIGKKAVHQHGRRLASVLPIIDGIICNLQSIGILIDNKLTNEAHIIARALFEKIITLLYLQCCKEEEFNRYISHTRQKTYRVLTRPIKLGGQDMTFVDAKSINLEEYPELKQSVDLFTTKKSKKVIKRWSKSQLPDKLELIGKSKLLSQAEMNPFLLFLSTYYDDASEAVHSTMYGCTFHFGGFSGGKRPTTDEEINIECNAIREGLLSIVSLQAGIIINYIANAYGLTDLSKPLKGLREQLHKEIT